MTTSYDIAETSVGDKASQHKRDVYSSLIKLRPQKYPFVSMLMGLDKRPVKNTKFELYEMDNFPLWFSVAAATAAATALTFTYTGGGSAVAELVTNDLFRIGSEVVRVSTTTGATATFTRGVAGTTAAAISTGTYAMRIGSSLAEDGTARTPISIQSSNVYNYTQLFNRSWGTTYRENNIEHYDGSPMKNNQVANLDLFKQEINAALWQGRRYKDSGTKPRTYTGGFFQFATENNYDVSATGILSLSQFCEIVFTVCNYGSTEKTVFAGKNLMGQVQGWFMNKPEVVAKQISGDGVKINFVRINYLGRTLDLVYEPLFEKDLAGYGAIVDMKYMKLAEFEKMRVIKNVQNPNEINETRDTIKGDLGLHFSNTKAHGVIKGLASLTGV